MNTRVGFSTQKYNPVSWLVRTITRSSCSHVWFLYYDQDFACDMVMDAHETGFRLIPYENFVKRNTVVAVLNPPENLDAGMAKAAKWIGTHYDFVGLFGMGMVSLARALRTNLRNPFRSQTSVFCSEAVASVMQWSHCMGTATWDPESIRPDDILEYLRQRSA